MQQSALLLGLNFGSLALAIALLVYLAISLRSLITLRRKLAVHETENLEAILTALIAKVKALEKQNSQTQEELTSNKVQTTLAVKKVGLVRFNSVADEGGNLSFSLALLDTSNTGVVITSLHGRQQSRMYAKAVINSVGEAPLNEEEQQAVIGAVSIHKIKTENSTQ